MKISPFIGFAGLLLACPAWALVKVDAAPSSLSQNESLHLTIESDAALGAAPDLSPLEQDFTIVQRSVSQSTQSFNGQTQQQTLLQLTLRPKRSGDLTIPALRIGADLSEPVQVRVTSGEAASPSSQPAQPYAPPAPMDWAGTQESSGGPTGWGAPSPSGGSVAGGGQDFGSLPADQDRPCPAPAATAPLADQQPAGSGIWPSLTGIALIGWLLTTLALWRQHGPWGWPRWRLWRPSGQILAVAPPQAPSANPSPSLDELIAGVQRAYQGDDPFAARDALLRWAAGVWPEHTPTNLSRLAARCSEPLQRHILDLERALYSPVSIPWNQQPVWRLLAGVGKPES